MLFFEYSTIVSAISVSRILDSAASVFSTTLSKFLIECPSLHDHNVGESHLHEIGQQAYEEQIGTREEFIKEFIRSYL